MSSPSLFDNDLKREMAWYKELMLVQVLSGPSFPSSEYKLYYRIIDYIILSKRYFSDVKRLSCKVSAGETLLHAASRRGYLVSFNFVTILMTHFLWVVTNMKIPM